MENSNSSFYKLWIPAFKTLPSSINQVESDGSNKNSPVMLFDSILYTYFAEIYEEELLKLLNAKFHNADTHRSLCIEYTQEILQNFINFARNSFSEIHSTTSNLDILNTNYPTKENSQLHNENNVLNKIHSDNEKRHDDKENTTDNTINNNNCLNEKTNTNNYKHTSSENTFNKSSIDEISNNKDKENLEKNESSLISNEVSLNLSENNIKPSSTLPSPTFQSSNNLNVSSKINNNITDLEEKSKSGHLNINSNSSSKFLNKFKENGGSINSSMSSGDYTKKVSIIKSMIFDKDFKSGNMESTTRDIDNFKKSPTKPYIYPQTPFIKFLSDENKNGWEIFYPLKSGEVEKILSNLVKRNSTDPQSQDSNSIVPVKENLSASILNNSHNFLSSTSLLSESNEFSSSFPVGVAFSTTKTNNSSELDKTKLMHQQNSDKLFEDTTSQNINESSIVLSTSEPSNEIQIEALVPSSIITTDEFIYILKKCTNFENDKSKQIFSVWENLPSLDLLIRRQISSSSENKLIDNINSAKNNMNNFSSQYNDNSNIDINDTTNTTEALTPYSNFHNIQLLKATRILISRKSEANNNLSFYKNNNNESNKSNQNHLKNNTQSYLQDLDQNENQRQIILADPKNISIDLNNNNSNLQNDNDKNTNSENSIAIKKLCEKIKTSLAILFDETPPEDTTLENNNQSYTTNMNRITDENANDSNTFNNNNVLSDDSMKENNNPMSLTDGKKQSSFPLSGSTYTPIRRLIDQKDTQQYTNFQSLERQNEGLDNENGEQKNPNALRSDQEHQVDDNNSAVHTPISRPLVYSPFIIRNQPPVSFYNEENMVQSEPRILNQISQGCSSVKRTGTTLTKTGLSDKNSDLRGRSITGSHIREVNTSKNAIQLTNNSTNLNSPILTPLNTDTANIHTLRHTPMKRRLGTLKVDEELNIIKSLNASERLSKPYLFNNTNMNNNNINNNMNNLDGGALDMVASIMSKKKLRTNKSFIPRQLINTVDPNDQNAANSLRRVVSLADINNLSHLEELRQQDWWETNADVNKQNQNMFSPFLNEVQEFREMNSPQKKTPSPYKMNMNDQQSNFQNDSNFPLTDESHVLQQHIQNDNIEGILGLRTLCTLYDHLVEEIHSISNQAYFFTKLANEFCVPVQTNEFI